MIEIVVAYDLDRCIGRNGDLPWRGQLPADMQHFRELTYGHTVIMGRMTWFSLPKRLDGRDHIVISRQIGPGLINGITWVQSIKAALDAAAKHAVMFGGPAYVIGGGEIYQQVLPLADTIHATLIKHHFGGDTFFPELGPDWSLTWSESHDPDERNLYPYTFLTYERRANGW